MMGEVGMADKVFIGVNVSKDWLDVAVAGGAPAAGGSNQATRRSAWLAELDPVAVAVGGVRADRRLRAGAGGLPAPARVSVHPNEVAAFRTRRGVKAKPAPGLDPGDRRDGCPPAGGVRRRRAGRRQAATSRTSIANTRSRKISRHVTPSPLRGESGTRAAGEGG